MQLPPSHMPTPAAALPHTGQRAPQRQMQPFCARCGSSRCRDAKAHAANG